LGLEEGNVMQIRIGRLRRMGRVYTELMGILGTISAGPDVGVMGDAEKMPNYKAQHQHPPTYRKMSPQARRVRRQRLFLMSTWLDDLLPDPHQGRSWMVNMLVDACKMVGYNPKPNPSIRISEYNPYHLTLIILTLLTTLHPSRHGRHRWY